MGGWARAAAATAATLVASVGVLSATTRPGSALVENDDLDTSAAYIYTVDTAAEGVLVRIELAVTADKPNRTVTDGYYQYYFTGYSLAIPEEALDLTVSDSSGNEIEFTREGVDEISDILTVDFRRNIFYRQTANLVIEYRLAVGAADSDSFVRLNPALATFIAWTSPQLEEATVSVVVPDGFIDRSQSDVPFTREITEEGVLQYVAAGEALDPETFIAVVSMTNDDALTTEQIVLPDSIEVQADASSAVEIRSWPGDDAWHQHVAEGVEEGLPIMVDIIGLPWPLDDQLVIMESFEPYLEGYGGWYDSETHVIEVGDIQDDELLYHELAHVWLHGDLFVHRWINEGLADLYAAETLAALGEERPEPMTTRPTDLDAIPLIAFDHATDPDEELWAYRASWGVIEGIEAEIGMEGIATVVDAASDRQYSYLGDVEPETLPTPTDWQRFLDLVENQQGISEGAVTELVREWVIAAGDSVAHETLFEGRRIARDRYFALAGTGDGWAPPVGLRREMTAWQFENATPYFDDAEAALAARDEILATIDPTNASLPAHLEVAYESIDDDDTALTRALDDAGAVADELRAAHDMSVTDHSIFQRVGLIGQDLPLEVDQAARAFSAGRLDEAIREADEVDGIVDGSSRAGLTRLVIVLAGLLVLTGIAFVLIRHGRRRRKPPALDGSVGIVGRDAPIDLASFPPPNVATAQPNPVQASPWVQPEVIYDEGPGRGKAAECQVIGET